jgi:hypothetical protein
LLWDPDLSPNLAQLLALVGSEPLALASVDLMLLIHLRKDSLAMPSSSTIFGIDLFEER